MPAAVIKTRIHPAGLFFGILVAFTSIHPTGCAISVLDQDLGNKQWARAMTDLPDPQLIYSQLCAYYAFKGFLSLLQYQEESYWLKLPYFDWSQWQYPSFLADKSGHISQNLVAGRSWLVRGRISVSEVLDFCFGKRFNLVERHPLIDRMYLPISSSLRS